MGIACPAQPVPSLVCSAMLSTSSRISMLLSQFLSSPQHPNGFGSDIGTMGILTLHSVKQDSVGLRLGLWASIDATGRQVG